MIRREFKIESRNRVRTLRTGSSGSSVPRLDVPVAAKAMSSAFGVASGLTMVDVALGGATDLELDRTLRGSIAGS